MALAFLLFILMGSFRVAAMEISEDKSKKPVPNQNHLAAVKKAFYIFSPTKKVTIRFSDNKTLKIDQQSFSQLADSMKTIKDYQDDNQYESTCDFSQSSITPEAFQLLSRIVMQLPNNDSSNPKNRTALIKDTIEKNTQPISIEQLEKLVIAANYLGADELVPPVSGCFVERSFPAIEKGEYIASNACGPLVADSVKAKLEQKLFAEPNFLESAVSRISNFTFICDVAINRAANHIVLGGLVEKNLKRVIYRFDNDAFTKQKEIFDTVMGSEGMSFDPTNDDLYCLCQNGSIVVLAPPYTQTKEFTSLCPATLQSINISSDGAHLVVVAQNRDQEERIGGGWVTIIDKKSKQQIRIDDKNGLTKTPYLYGASLSDDKKYLKLWDFDRRIQKIGELSDFANEQKNSQSNSQLVSAKSAFSEYGDKVTISDDSKCIAWLEGKKIKIRELSTGREAEADCNILDVKACLELNLGFIQNGRYLLLTESGSVTFMSGQEGGGASKHIMYRIDDNKNLSLDRFGENCLPAYWQKFAKISGDGKCAVYQDLQRSDTIELLDIDSLQSFHMQSAFKMPICGGAFHQKKPLLVLANQYGHLQLTNFERWASYIEKTKTGGIEKTQEVFHEMKKELSERKRLFTKKQEVNQPSSTSSLSVYNPLAGLALITNALSSFNPSSTNNNKS